MTRQGETVANRETARLVRTTAGAAIVAALLSLAWLALMAPSANAAYSHNVVEKTFETDCDSPNPEGHIEDMAIHEATETIYVFCAGIGQSGQGGKILKYNFNGNTSEFTANVPYVTGNAITANPASASGSLGPGFSGVHIAVDNSGGQSDGYIYVISGGSENLDVFKPSGEYSASKVQPYCAGSPYDVDIGDDGFVYFVYGGYCARVSKYSPSLEEVGRFHIRQHEPSVFTTGSKLAADNDGALWLISPNQLFKVENDQFATQFPASPLGSDMDSIEAELSPYVPFPLLQGTDVLAPDVDWTDNDLYVNRGNRIETYSQGTAEEPPYQNAPTFGTGPLVNSSSMILTSDHRVLASTEGHKVVRFGPGAILPDVKTHVADIDDIGHTGATLTGNVKLAGGGAVTACELQIGTAPGVYSLPPIPCTPPAFATDSGVSASPSGLTTGTTYHYRFKATNASGSNVGINRSFTPAFVLKVQTLPATGIEQNKATLQGSFDPDGISTSYYFEYGVSTNYGQQTTPVVYGSTPGNAVVGTQLTGLPAGKVFNYRIVASNVNGTTKGPNLTFRTASPPDVTGLRASDLTASSAVLHAKINPVGYATTYRFEYGTSPEYGQEIPIPDAAVGAGTTPVSVQQTLTNLQPGFTYHYRVVATNQWGSTTTSDTTFDYSPPSCPNDHIRQQTGASYLPDCRAYELVSPAAAGSVQLYPGEEMRALAGGGQNPYAELANWVQNDGLATSPSRLAFLGLAGTIDGLRAPNVLIPDTYISTRTSTGWTTTLPGIDDSFGQPYGKQCSDSMDLCIDHSASLSGEGTNRAPYLYTVEGVFKGRLPTNVGIIKGGLDALGYKRLSPNFNHYFFSSNAYEGFQSTPGAAFAPGGLTSGAGSAYDNDLSERTVSLISKLNNGEDIPQNGSIPGNGSIAYAMEIPAVSTSGSHVLLSTKSGPDGPYRLYMRVGGGTGVTYEVTPPGTEATEFVGMTRDGGEVLFTTPAALEGDDKDTAVDLYLWREADESLTRLSKAPGEQALGKEGNKTACGATWTAGCNVQPLDPERRWAVELEIPPGNPGVPYLSMNGIDDVFADDSGDVYFYSPEQLDATNFGIPGQRNLYLYRNGSVRLVAIFDTGTTIERMQISSDGSHAAMVTKSNLTSYDNDGFRQMYTLDADSGAIRCASCLPSGQPPSAHIQASHGGPFMSDDGRAFFTTKDRLVPRDNNGVILDVYEYVDGRPQLISSGLSARDFTGQSETLGLFTVPQNTGLESVSADGTDVFFSTFDTLVDGDQNGEFVKFYDARTGGGFAEDPVLAPCAAADECHGVDSSAPAPPPQVSSTNLGNGGNVKSQAKKKKKKGKKKKKKSKRKNSRRGNG